MEWMAKQTGSGRSQLLEAPGGKERMTAYFEGRDVRRRQALGRMDFFGMSDSILRIISDGFRPKTLSAAVLNSIITPV